MPKRTTKILIGCILTLLLTLSITNLTFAQTIPTRTPTPSPTIPPTATSDDGGDDGGGNNTPVPTPLPEDTPTPIPTSTTAVTVAPTPEDGFYPTALPCGDEPTLQALSTTNVRGGPGLGYDVVGTLVFLEVRPVTGRAEFTDWWQVRMFDNSVGWVSDAVVTVQGYTGLVPIITPPPLPDGTTPTPVALWEPTPNPSCTPQPTATPTETPMNTPTPLSDALVDNTATPEPTSTATEEAIDAATEELTDEEAVVAEAPIEPTTTLPALPTAVEQDVTADTASDPESTTISATSASVPTIEPSETDGEPTIPWVPVVGAGLVVVGVGVFVVRRR